MFSITPVFVQKNKKAFVEFLLSRINDFAEVTSNREWDPNMAWKPAHIDDLLTEFSLGTIFFPFSSEQLLVIVDCLRKGKKGSLFVRYTNKELVDVLGKEKSGNNVKEYFTAMIDALKEWEQCPLGFSSQDTEEIVDDLLDQILCYSGAADTTTAEDPAILEEAESTTDDLVVEDEDEEEAEEEEEVPNEDGEAEAEEEEVSSTEEEVEEVEPPKKVPPKKIVPKAAPKKTQGRYRIPQGPVLKMIIDLVISCTQPPKDLTDAQVASAATKLREFSRTLDGQADSLEGFVAIMMKQAITICDPKSKPNNYQMSDVVTYVIESLE